MLEKVDLSLSHPGPLRLHARATNGASALAQSEEKETLVARDISPDAIRRVIVTGGNIRNNHFYLPLDFFPDEAIGGRNKSEAAARTISVTFRPGRTIETEIDRTKRIFRARSAVGEFFAKTGIGEGDKVRLVKTGAFSYEVSKEANG